MSAKSYIKKSIVTFIEQNSTFYSDFTNWYVGITADPDTRYTAHGSPTIWREWQADSHHHARDIEAHFLEQGMKGDVGGGKYPRYVYVYKHSGPGS